MRTSIHSFHLEIHVECFNLMRLGTALLGGCEHCYCGLDGCPALRSKEMIFGRLNDLVSWERPADITLHSSE